MDKEYKDKKNRIKRNRINGTGYITQWKDGIG